MHVGQHVLGEESPAVHSSKRRATIRLAPGPREKQSLLSSQLLSEQLLSVLKSGESRGVWLPHRFL